MSDFVYPRGNAQPSEESALSDSEIAEVIVEAREAGHPSKMAYTMAVAQSGAPKTCKRVLNEIDEEIRKMDAVDLSVLNSEIQYSIELGKVRKYLDVNTWIAFKKEALGADTFDDMKEAVKPIEPTVDEKLILK